MNELSIIIPVLNEEANIKLLIPKIFKYLKKIKLKKYEIILVDDDSKDRTQEVVEKLKKKNNFLKIFIRKDKNKDLSKSCIFGFKKSKYKNILVMDGDFQHNPKYIVNLYNIFKKNNCDFVIGARNLTSRDQTKLSIFRLGISIIIIKFINLMLGKKTKDPLSGFFIFKKKFFMKNRKKLYSKGYKILSDLLYSTKQNLNIKDINISFDKRAKGESKIKIKILLIFISFVLKKFVNG